MRLPQPTTLPWGRPRHELLLLALVAGVALVPVDTISPQDVSRLCLTRSLAHGHLTVDNCIGGYAADRAVRAGHVYSDKAPGLSVLALPAATAIGLTPPSRWDPKG